MKNIQGKSQKDKPDTGPVDTYSPDTAYICSFDYMERGYKVTPSELSALYDIKRILDSIKAYCENRSLSYDGEYERWKYVASEANYGLIKVKDIERGIK